MIYDNNVAGMLEQFLLFPFFVDKHLVHNCGRSRHCQGDSYKSVPVYLSGYFH